MKAIVTDGYGGAENLRLLEVPKPKVGPDQVLVRVKAAGVNPVDWKVTAGGLDGMMYVHFPLIPGWDAAGVVEELGADTPEFAVGDEVLGYVRRDEVGQGTYAEYVAAPVRTLTHKPAALGWQQAAALPLAGLTALRSLDRVGAGDGETVLVHGGAGGVGSLGVQLAVLRGARVIATASERNHDFLRSLGAEPLTYGEGLADRVRELAPDGVDAALDFAGGGGVQVSHDVLKDPARSASIADGEVKKLGGQVVWVRPDAEGLAHLAGLAAAGKLTVHVEALPLAEAAEAFRRSESGRTRGKLVLDVP
ncbi:NADP-dependent oxidoreductase [Streptomyces sp. NBC_01808]|uniref:NADP-dependent oxidoreductase n=1 Tax=Streptomyces sp. NBC_01808 TaxID=2975947 RepID=UPI002DDC3979|nr:NADP-dependent oxidoreductase [Streptomyces sp. NBC_01808]WSA40592.1 NADP-dependent oxidoreductase [Streptomyces sp. NBC_01808]